MTEYDDAVKRRDQIVQDITLENERHTTTLRRLTSDLNDQGQLIRAIEAGMDQATFLNGRAMINITWRSQYVDGVLTRIITAEVRSAAEAAIEDLRHDRLDYLIRGYYGVKSYDRWASQRSDAAYGMGPSHGSLWFAVGLHRGKAYDPLNDFTEERRLHAIAYIRAVLANPDLLD